jgi:ketosteroid isomerase-like protein
MSIRKLVVERYFDGFRKSDHEQILGCLTDDVIWDLPGYRHLAGKEAFDGEIENENFVGSPVLTVDRLVEEGDTVVAIGEGEATRVDGVSFRFAYSDVFTFAGDEIRRVESYLVPLTPPPSGTGEDGPDPVEDLDVGRQQGVGGDPGPELLEHGAGPGER